MSPAGTSDDRLRELFREAASGAPATPDCPPADELWDAASGRADSGSLQQIVLHLGTCAACAEDWRLARATMEEAGLAAPETSAAEPLPFAPRPTPERGAARPRWPWAAGLAAAAALFAAVTIQWPRGDDVMRGGGNDGTGDPAVEQSTISRTQPVVTWESPSGARCDLIVTSADLGTIVASVRAVEAGELRLEPASLDGLAAGERLRWLLECELASGRNTSTSGWLQLEGGPP